MIEKLKSSQITLEDQGQENSKDTQVDKTKLLFTSRTNRRNLFATCFIWSMSGFSYYFLMYYTKYFKGNFYVSFAVQGISICFGIGWLSLLSNRMEVKNVLRTMIVLIVVLLSIGLVIYNTENVHIYLPFILFATYLQISAIQDFGYHINQYLFPVLVRGQAYGYVNFISRPFGGVAAVLAEYTDDPLIYVLLFSLSAFFVVFLMEKPDHA